MIVVAAFYRFVKWPERSAKTRADDEDSDDDNKLFVEILCDSLRHVSKRFDVRGNVRVAQEGVNGTVSGGREGIDAFVDMLNAAFAACTKKGEFIYKESRHEVHPFRKMTCKVKAEIVTFGPHRLDPVKEAGTYVDPSEWDSFVRDDDVTVIDVRNTYEVAMGTFRGAIDPQTETFQDFVRFAEQRLDRSRPKKIAMFCTGGIRCEKATAFLKSKGFRDVYHLKGGILQYLRDVPKEKSSFYGECYVFDRRVSVDHTLRCGSYEQCFACRAAVSRKTREESSRYVPGVCCPNCYEKFAMRTDSARRRLRERHDRLSSRGNKEPFPSSRPSPDAII